MYSSAAVPVTIVPAITGSVGVMIAPITIPIHHGTPKKALTMRPLIIHVPGMITSRTTVIAFHRSKMYFGETDRDTQHCETEG